MFIICQTSIINMAKVCIGNSNGREAPDARREPGLGGGIGCMCKGGIVRLFSNGLFLGFDSVIVSGL